MKTIVLIALFIVMCTTFGTGIFLSLKHPNHTSIALIQYTAATICLMFLFLSKFKRFKIFQVEAETWNETQNKAETLLKNLESASIANAQCAYSALMGIGRFAEAISAKDRFDMAQELETSLKELGFSKEQIKKTKKHFNRMVIGDIASPIIESINEKFFQIQREIDKEGPEGVIDDSNREDHKKYLEKREKVSDEIESFKSAIRYRDDEGSNLLDIIENYFSTSKFLKAEQIKIIKDEYNEDFENLKSYIENNELTYPDSFFNKNK